jgi:hypothetical protein
LRVSDANASPEATVMSPEDLLELLRTRPFVPFRSFATDGRTYEVRHPDQALVLRARIILPLPALNGIPERSEHLALIHVVRFEELESPWATSPQPPAGVA